MTEGGFGEGNWCTQVPRHSPDVLGKVNTPCVPCMEQQQGGMEITWAVAGAAPGRDGMPLAPWLHHLQQVLLQAQGGTRDTFPKVSCTCHCRCTPVSPGDISLDGMFSSLQQGWLCLKSILFPAYSLNKAGWILCEKGFE